MNSLTLLANAWGRFLESLAEGAQLEEALLKAGLTSGEVTEITLNPAEATRFFDAQQLARRRTWPVWDVDAVCARVAAGMTAKAAVIAVKGEDLTSELFELLESDAALAARFETAERVGARAMEESLLEIADDKSGDILETAKGPIPSSAAVGRSKLQVDTRLRLMTAKNRPRYAEKAAPVVAVQVNIDHAERLEEARVRARDHRATPRLKVIDAPFTDVTPAPAAEAPAEKAEPVSTLWLEEGAPAPAEAPAAEAEPEAGEPKPGPWYE
jgi:hypothetical protein